jgi:ABC-type transport system involved in multi-copper enzyme maturation permease subunit
MIRLIGAELFKLRKRRMTWTLAGLLVALVALVYVLLLLAILSTSTGAPATPGIDALEGALAPAGIPSFGYSLVYQLGAIMGIILTGSAIGTEYGWRTVVTVTAWVGDRTGLVLSKVVTLALIAAGGVILGVLACLVGSLVVGIARDTLAASDFTGTLLSQTVLGGIRTWYVILIYMLLTAALAYLGRSTTLGIAVGLAMLFLESLVTTVLTLLDDRFAFLNDLLISTNASALLAANGDVGGFEQVATNGPSPWQAALVLALYGVGFLAISIFIFNRRDITE